MRIKPIHLLLALLATTAIALLLLNDWSSMQLLTPRHLWGLVFLLFLALFADATALTLTVSRSSSSSLAFLPLFVALVLFGTSGALAFIAVAGGLGEVLVRRKPWLRATYNWSQFVIATALAGRLFHLTGGEAHALGATGDLETQVLPLMAAAGFIIGFNQLAVAVAIAITEKRKIKRVLSKMTSAANANLLYGWLLSPAAIGLAFLYERLWIAGLILAFLPMTFIRHAYLTNHRLQETNRALLKALVKAIETRDPYTSGHSLRVASLSRRIAESMSVGEKRLEAIETAALLHDIGKIEAIYTEILKKPGDLSEQEREIIQSHVTKGVELLTSLGSFPKEVIDSVRHHHEREDGKGYPDGIGANEIPLGARIIKVVDAVDAMLSDRPYRRALSLDQVREQLLTYAGTQFNETIVKVVVESDLLSQHASDLADWRPATKAQDLDDWQTSAPISPGDVRPAEGTAGTH